VGERILKIGQHFTQLSARLSL